MASGNLWSEADRLHLSNGAAKRLIDIIGSLVFFSFFGFFYVAVWIGVLVTTGAPAIYRHSRIGKGGVPFDCLKFRSMVPDSDAVLSDLLQRDVAAKAEWDETFKLKKDPRITKFGRFIRRTSLDELPQFWNVLRGDMSLVGPRPVVQRELDCFYGGAAEIYAAVKPGITGPWQIGGRSDLSYADRVLLDCEYVKNRSTKGDLIILWRTIKVVFSGSGSY
nr:sugar transferase [Variovorax ginsengisoli]